MARAATEARLHEAERTAAAELLLELAAENAQLVRRNRYLEARLGEIECADCGGSGWQLPAPGVLRRCHCNPERGVPAYTPYDAQPARLPGGAT